MANMYDDDDDNDVEYINELNEKSRRAQEKAAETTGKAIKNSRKIGKTIVKIFTKLPILLPILIIIFIIIYIFALRGFLSSMPGMFLGKLKETGRSLWRNVVGFITGDFDYVDSEDVEKLAQYLQNQGYDVQGYGFGDVKYTDDSENSFNSGKTKQIETVIGVKYRRNYLHSYIAASEETYQLAQYSVWGDLKATGAKISNALNWLLNVLGFKDDFEPLGENPSIYSTGLLNIRGLDKSNIGVDREGEKLNIYTSTERGRKFGSMYSYDLSGWTSVYGRPIEMFIALHLATGMPDLTYEIATHDDFNTKVNINIHNVTINYDTDKQLEIINPRAGEIYVKSRIEAAYYEHVIDRVRDEYQKVLALAAKKRSEGDEDAAKALEARAEALLRLIAELEAHRGNKEDIDKFLFDLYENGFSISGAASSAFGFNDGASCDMYEVRGSGDSHLNGAYNDQMQEMMDIVHYGKIGIKHANLPYIASVSKHWYYDDIEFTVGEGGVYRASHQATKDIHYDAEGTVLEEFTTTIWDALLTDEDGTGIFYQVNEPYVEGPNKYIIKRFHEKYYRYDGTIERAHAIAKAELIKGKKKQAGYKYIFNGQGWQLNKDDETSYDDNLPEKETPSFGTPQDTLSAFDILKQVHTEDSDAIYRMLKELATSEAIEGHIERETIEEDLKQVLLWPFETDDDSKKWNVSKDQNEYGIVIDDVEGETFVMPGDGTITLEGNKAIIEFDTLQSSGEGGYGTVEILTKKFVEDDFYRINPDIVKGKKMIIEGVDITEPGKATRGDIIGTSQSQVKIVMQHEDKSIIGKSTDNNVNTIDDDIESYMNPKYTTHTEEMVIKALTESNGVAAKGAGVKTSDWFINSLNGDKFHGYMDINNNYNGGNNNNYNNDINNNNASNGNNSNNNNGQNNGYINKSESKPVDGALSDKVGNDMDLVYAIVAAESLNTYESAYAVISCLANRLTMAGNATFTGGKDMTTLVKVSNQWDTFGKGQNYGKGSYLQYYPKSKLEKTKKGATVIKAVDDCIRTGIVSHNFNSFYASTEHYRNLVKKEIKEDNGDVTDWDKYCREIGGNFYYKLRGGKYVAEDA